MSSWLDDPVGEVRRRADIVEIVSESVVLKRSGRNYLGLCPFHGERTPSFNVNPERQIFRCFGCGEGGDVFSFLMKAHNQTFPEALKTLAERYGVALPERQQGEGDDKALLREVMALASDFFRRMLAHGEFGLKARSYLEERDVSAEMQSAFQLGYAPPQWDALHRYLLGERIPTSLQEKVGLVRPRSSGDGHYDYFRHRLIFPIHNEAGVVVGFGGRAIESGDEPKYLNSPETPLYHKGSLLFGLSQARESIKARDTALLMEGYMDVITAHANGLQHAVGVLGTALTPAQARTLLRYTPSKRIVIAFDADRAGQQAAERGLSTLSDVARGVGLSLRVLCVPEGKDPDAFLRARGASAFERLAEEAPGLYRFLLERALAPIDLASSEGKIRAVAACVPVLAQIERGEGKIALDQHIKWLAEKLGVREESIRLDVRKVMSPTSAAPRAGWTPFKGKGLPAWEAQQILLYFMVEQPSVRARVSEQLAAVPFEPLYQEIRLAVEQLAAEQGSVTWADIQDFFAGRADLQRAVSAMMFAEYEAWGAEFQRAVEDSIDTLLFNFWQGELSTLKERLKSEAQALDAESHRAIVSRLSELSTYCVHLKHKRGNISVSTGVMSEEN